MQNKTKPQANKKPTNKQINKTKQKYQNKKKNQTTRIFFLHVEEDS